MDYHNLDIWLPAHFCASESTGRRGTFNTSFLALKIMFIHIILIPSLFVGELLPNPWLDRLLPSAIGHRCSNCLPAKILPVAIIFREGETTLQDWLQFTACM